jgi:hypothetical protein
VLGRPFAVCACEQPPGGGLTFQPLSVWCYEALDETMSPRVVAQVAVQAGTGTAYWETSSCSSASAICIGASPGTSLHTASRSRGNAHVSLLDIITRTHAQP